MKNYSCLIFQADIEENTAAELVSILKQGTKIFFFTYDPIDSLLENDLIKFAKDSQLFFGYEIRFHEDLLDSFSYRDGEVPNHTLELLDRNADYFNKEQYLIEHAPVHEHISVSAGAGTGKTTVMLSRILYLKYIHPDITFSELALITFTNKAANNMREKLIQKIKDYFKITNHLVYLDWLDEVKEMLIGTIHSFAHQILKSNINSIFENKDIRVSKFTYKRRKIIEEVIDKFHENEPAMFAKFKYVEQYRIINAIESIIDQIGNYSLTPESVQHMNFGYADDNSHVLFSFVVKETLNRLEALKTDTGYIEVNDLINQLDLFKSQEANYDIPFKYIFIDEFQDTDRQQTKFFSYLANHYPISLFVVGDVKQSIYRFRGADYTAFDQLKSQTMITEEYFLQYNYRTDEQLLDNLNHIFTAWPRLVSTFEFGDRDSLVSGFEPDNQLEEPFVNNTFPTSVSLAN